MITKEQRNAASFYWTQILTGELKPKNLSSSIENNVFPSLNMFMKEHKQKILDKLNTDDPSWPMRFMKILDALINKDSEKLFYLYIDYEPCVLLKEAAKQANVPVELFPSGKLSMSFDNDNNIIVEDTKINAKNFIENEAQKMISSVKL